jgi:2,4-dienoyl-CoA reductase-like NADH-dependent reductase (Old Yellow Enzyme family)
MERLLNKTIIFFFSLARSFLQGPDLAARWEHGDPTSSKCIICGKRYVPQSAAAQHYHFQMIMRF